MPLGHSLFSRFQLTCPLAFNILNISSGVLARKLSLPSHLCCQYYCLSSHLLRKTTATATTKQPSLTPHCLHSPLLLIYQRGVLSLSTKLNNHASIHHLLLFLEPQWSLWTNRSLPPWNLESAFSVSVQWKNYECAPLPGLSPPLIKPPFLEQQSPNHIVPQPVTLSSNSHSVTFSGTYITLFGD